MDISIACDKLFLYFWSTESTITGAGHSAVGIGNDYEQTFFEAMPSKPSPVAPMAFPYTHTGNMDAVLSNAHNKNRPELILSIPVKQHHRLSVIKSLQAFFNKSRKFHFKVNNCADVCLCALSAIGMKLEKNENYGVSTPFGVLRSLIESEEMLARIQIIEGSLYHTANDDSFNSMINTFGVSRDSVPFLTSLYSIDYIPTSLLHPFLFKLYEFGLFRQST